MKIFRSLENIAKEMGIVSVENQKFGNPVKYIIPATKTNLLEDLIVKETGNGIEIETECVHVMIWEKDESESRMQVDICGDYFTKRDQVLLARAAMVLSKMVKKTEES